MQTNWIIIITEAVFGVLFVGFLIWRNFKDGKTFEKSFDSDFGGADRSNTENTQQNNNKAAYRKSRALLVNFVIYVLFLMTSALILINRLTAVYITSYWVHFVLLFVAVATFVISIGHFFGKLKSNRSITITFLIVFVICAFKAFFSWGGDWKTQVILYRSVEDPDVTIESQMRDDPFSVTYKNRIVEVEKIAPFIVITHNIDTVRLNPAKWQRINKR